MCFAKTNGKIPNSERIACSTDLTQKRDEKAATRRRGNGEKFVAVTEIEQIVSALLLLRADALRIQNSS